MSEEQQKHIDESDYQEHLKDVGKADFSQEEKDAFRKLLAAGYRNLNGDPMEKKVQMLARTDWLQIQKSIADSKKTLHIMAMLEEIKSKVDATKKTQGFAAQLFDFLKDAKSHLTTIVVAAILFPNGGAILKTIGEMLKGN